MEEIIIKDEADWPKEEKQGESIKPDTLIQDEALAADGRISYFPLEEVIVKFEPIKVEAVESSQDIGEEPNGREEITDGTVADWEDCRNNSVCSFGVECEDGGCSSDQDTCIQCGRTYASSLVLLLHRSAGQKLYCCKICKESSCTFQVLSEHMISHLGKKVVPCCHCDRMFCNNKEFLKHMISHGEEKIFVCPECDKAFRLRSTLLGHLLTHTKERGYGCHYCNRKFVHIGTLRRHEQTHTGEKPLSCSECDKRFPRKFNLRQHMTTHSSVKSYQCPLCDKAFNRNSSMHTHMLKHSGVKPHSCTECGSRFYNVKS